MEQVKPQEAGCIFKGWYKEASCTNLWNFSTDTVTENTTLYAKWTVTIGYAIGADFPEQSNAWTSGESLICYRHPFAWAMSPAMCFDNIGGDGNISLPCYGEVAETVGGYIYQDSSRKYTLTFKMNGTVLESIIFTADEGAEDSVKNLAGTYVATTYDEFKDTFDPYKYFLNVFVLYVL